MRFRIKWTVSYFSLARNSVQFMGPYLPNIFFFLAGIQPVTQKNPHWWPRPAQSWQHTNYHWPDVQLRWKLCVYIHFHVIMCSCGSLELILTQNASFCTGIDSWEQIFLRWQTSVFALKSQKITSEPSRWKKNWVALFVCELISLLRHLYSPPDKLELHEAATHCTLTL